jgi:hypothetical protein
LLVDEALVLVETKIVVARKFKPSRLTLCDSAQVQRDSRRRPGSRRHVFNGAVFRERLISSDDSGRRLAWTIVDGPWTHHNGSVELFAEPEGRARSVWTTDILPHESAVDTQPLIHHACRLIKTTLEKDKAARE